MERSEENISNEFLNLNGRICFAGLITFGIGTIAAVYLLAPIICNEAEKISLRSRKTVAIVLCLELVADIVCCIIWGFNSGDGIGGRI